MKICHIANYLPQYHKVWGGAEQGAIRIIELFRDKGNETIVCTCRHNIDGQIDNVKSYELPIWEDKIGNPKFKINVNSFKYVNGGFDSNSYKALLKILKKEKPNICHFHNIDQLSLSVLKAAKKLKIPSIITLYDYWPFCSRKILLDKYFEFCNRYNCKFCTICMNIAGNRKKEFLAKLFYKKQKRAKKLLSYCDFVHVLSENSKSISMDYGIPEEKILVHPTFFDIKKTGDPVNRDKRHVLFVGWFLNHKGIHVIIEAIGLLKKKYPNIKLSAFGEGMGVVPAYAENIFKRIDELGLKENVDIIGKAGFPVIEEYLKKATVVTIAEQWNNMGPVILLEALSYKIPIIASNLGAMPEMLDHGKAGHIAEYNNPQDWADKLESVFINPEKNAEMVNNGFARVKLYCDEDTYFTGLNLAYQKMLRKR